MPEYTVQRFEEKCLRDYAMTIELPNFETYVGGRAYIGSKFPLSAGEVNHHAKITAAKRTLDQVR